MTQILATTAARRHHQISKNRCRTGVPKGITHKGITRNGPEGVENGGDKNANKSRGNAGVDIGKGFDPVDGNAHLACAFFVVANNVDVFAKAMMAIEYPSDGGKEQRPEHLHGHNTNFATANLIKTCILNKSQRDTFAIGEDVDQPTY